MLQVKPLHSQPARQTFFALCMHSLPRAALARGDFTITNSQMLRRSQDVKQHLEARIKRKAPTCREKTIKQRVARKRATVSETQRRSSKPAAESTGALA